MSDSQAYEEVTVYSDGVTVVKRFEEDEFPVPAIAFEFSSDRDEGVSVRLSDTVPDDVEVEDLGFHPEYGSEFWTIDNDTITFERDLEAEASYTTVYGIRATGSDDVEQFLTEPTLEEVDPPLPEEEKTEDDAADENIVPESGDDVVKEAIAGEGEIPGLEKEEDESEDEDEDVATLELNDPNEPETTQTEESDDDTAAVPSDSVVSAIADEIRQNNVSKDDLKLLRRAFEVVGDDSGGATDARIQQIQNDISDLRAYTSALEEFLGENGTGEQLIGEFEEQLDDFESQLGDIESELADNSEELSAVSGEVDDIGEEVESVSNEFAGVSSNVSSLDEEVNDLQAAVDDIESSVDELEEEVTDGDVAERIDEIESQLSELQEWQEQIKSTFG